MFFNYDGNWNSVYRELIRQAFGETVADKRKAMTAYMGDAFTGEWIFATIDEADFDKPFTTKNVAQFLADAHKF